MCIESSPSQDFDASHFQVNAVDPDHESSHGDYESGAAMNVSDPDNENDSANSMAQFENAVDEKKVHRDIARLFCSAALPPQMVEDYFFSDFLYSLNPHFRPKVDMIETCCLEIHEELKSKVKQILGDLDCTISLSVDILRYERRYDFAKDYLCLAANFIDQNWKLKKRILKFSNMWDGLEEFPHVLVLESLKDWDIENKISLITMVNNEFETIAMVKDKIQEKCEFQLNGFLFQVKCCGDIISLMVQDAYEKIENIIHKVRGLYSFGKSLPLWYLTSSHLKDALALNSFGEYSSQDVLDNYDVPSADEWEKFSGICKLLDNIFSIANLLFEAKYCTASIYYHHLRELQSILIQESTGSDAFISSAAKEMLEKFDEYWKDMHLVLAIAMVMDPRFKMKCIEFSSSKFKGSDPGSAVNFVKEEIQSLYSEYVIKFPQEDNFFTDSSSSESEEEDACESVKAGDTSSGGDFKLLPEYKRLIESDGRSLKSELDLYLEEPVIPWREDFNALSWWRTAGQKYPTLSRMARDFLAIPISIATSYAAFYTEPREADERIVSTGSEMMNVY